ncbi:MAG: helix-turn-helix domain-containing protein [Elusimicrobiota bacterium]
MPERIYEKIGRRIREIRKGQELSLEDLADRAGLTASYLGQVERFERKASLLTVGKIAAALDVSPAAFHSFGKESRDKRTQTSFSRRAVRVLDGLPEKRRDFTWDTLMFLVRRLRRER